MVYYLALLPFFKGEILPVDTVSVVPVLEQRRLGPFSPADRTVYPIDFERHVPVQGTDSSPSEFATRKQRLYSMEPG